MTRENAKTLLPVIQAYAEGKAIQIKNFGVKQELHRFAIGREL